MRSHRSVGDKDDVISAAILSQLSRGHGVRRRRHVGADDLQHQLKARQSADVQDLPQHGPSNHYVSVSIDVAHLAGSSSQLHNCIAAVGGHTTDRDCQHHALLGQSGSRGTRCLLQPHSWPCTRLSGPIPGARFWLETSSCGGLWFAAMQLCCARRALLVGLALALSERRPCCSKVDLFPQQYM
jgi:hypothetical protein